MLGLLGRGFSNAAIASKLGLTEGTVRNHVSAVLGKLGVSVGMVKEGPTEREAAIVGEHFEYLQAHARAGMRAELYQFRLAIG